MYIKAMVAMKAIEREAGNMSVLDYTIFILVAHMFIMTFCIACNSCGKGWLRLFFVFSGLCAMGLSYLLVRLCDYVIKGKGLI